MRIKYDVKDVEGGQDFDTPIPIGVYPAKIDSLAEDTSKSSGNPMLVAIYKISAGDWKGRLLWDYIVLNDSSAWKLKQFIVAVGLREKGNLDTKKLVGTSVRVRVRHDSSEEFGTRAKVGAVLPIHSEDDDEEDDDEPEDEVEEDATEDEDEGDEEEEEYTYEDIQEMDIDELKELIDEEELEVRVTKKSKVETVRDKVAEALELEEPEDDDEEEGEEEEDEEPEEEDYSDWEVADLKAELKERGLSTAGTKKTLIKKLEKDDESDEPF